MAKTKIALLYERLSRDDELNGESFSIQNQKIMLEDFARRNGYPRFKHFTDDGVSGTRFDRPGFMAMMEEVEDGNVEAIIIKDMSRMGRDYLKVGQVMEILRQRGVRLIAINDNVDTDKGDNDMTPFLNIMYEFYARDTSRKIKSVFKAKGMSGKHLTGFVPYGYLWDEKRENWIVDDEAADVIRRIYAMTLEGYGPFQIASRLTADKIEMPAVHMARHGEGLHKTRDIKDPCQWSTSTVVNILKRREYLGHTVNFKTRKHFKDKKSHYVDESEWTIFENTHEAIISQADFDAVQSICDLKQKEYHANLGKYDHLGKSENILKGLVYCGDCGRPMVRYKQVVKGKKVSYHYMCPNYAAMLERSGCAYKFLREDILLAMEYNELDDEQAKALLELPDAMSDLCDTVKEKDSRQQETIWHEIEERANVLAAGQQPMQEQSL